MQSHQEGETMLETESRTDGELQREERTKEEWEQLNDQRFRNDYKVYSEHEENYRNLSGRASELGDWHTDRMRNSAQYMYNFALYWGDRKRSGTLRRVKMIWLQDHLRRSVQSVKGVVYYRDIESEQNLNENNKH